MTHRLATAMQKGGVGKSTTSINLAGALADDTDRTSTDGHDVLLVDADPQGFTTIMFGLTEYYTDGDAFSLYDCLTDIDEFDRVGELIHEFDEFDVLASHGENFMLERELWSLSRTQERLGMALDRLPDEYDYVIIDSPPNLGPLADGALLAAENVLFASKADKIASFSMNLLMNEIGTLEQEFATTIDSVAAVVNLVEDNNISNERIEWFVENIGEDHLVIVPDTVAIEGALDQGGSVFNPGYAPENRHRREKADDVRDRYDQLAQLVEAHYA